MEIEAGIYEFRLKFTRNDGELEVEYSRRLIDDKEELYEIRDKLIEYVRDNYPNSKDVEVRWNILPKNDGWW